MINSISAKALRNIKLTLQRRIKDETRQNGCCCHGDSRRSPTGMHCYLFS